MTEHEKPSFEQAIAELESLVEKMESGQMSLEASVQAYTRGAELARLCKEQLASAELRLSKLNPNGVLEPVVPEVPTAAS